MKRFFFTLLLVPLLQTGAANDADADLKKAISRFSVLFSKGDHKALLKSKLVRLPLLLKGTMDDSPEIKANAKVLAKALTKIAGQPSGLNAANLNETEAEHLTASLKAGKLPEDAGEGSLRTGNLVFKKSGKNWQLVKVYVSDELIESLQKKSR
jgi:mannitol-specific phosphotransferase system IIBC component